MTQWGVAPVILVFADTEEGAAMASDGAMASGARVAATLPPGGGLARIDAQVAVDLIIMDISLDGGPELDGLLRRIGRGVEEGAFAAILIIAPELLDIVVAQIDHPAIAILVGRDAAALEEALVDRLQRAEPQLRDGSRDSRMERPHFPVGEVRPALDEEEGGDSVAVPDGNGMSPAPLRLSDASAIRDMIRARRLREELFGSGLFADPAWDILLDLSAARIEGRSVAVSSLCIAAAVPATTALRWIKQLTEAGLLRRVADPDDGRRVFIELTDRAATAMKDYFRAVPGDLRG